MIETTGMNIKNWWISIKLLIDHSEDSVWKKWKFHLWDQFTILNLTWNLNESYRLSYRYLKCGLYKYFWIFFTYILCIEIKKRNREIDISSKMVRINHDFWHRVPIFIKQQYTRLFFPFLAPWCHSTRAHSTKALLHVFLTNVLKFCKLPFEIMSQQVFRAVLYAFLETKNLLQSQHADVLLHWIWTRSH